MSQVAVVAGVGMIPFTNQRNSTIYGILTRGAACAALSGVSARYGGAQRACIGYVYGDSLYAQAALCGVSQTDIPVGNVHNNCSTGSSALSWARQAGESGAIDCVLPLGFEPMRHRALTFGFADRPTPFDRFNAVMNQIPQRDDSPFAARLFGSAGKQYADKYGITPEDVRKVSVKPRQDATNNANLSGTVFKRKLREGLAATA